MYKNKIFKNFIILFVLFQITGCSIKKVVMNNLLNSTGSSISSIYLTENDPELVRESLPTNIKLIELLIQQSPENPSLLISACQAITVYSYAFILRDAELVLDEDFKQSRVFTERGKKLLKRAREYGYKAIESKYPDFFINYSQNPKKTLENFNEKDLDVIYWVAASWALLISISQENPKMLAELPDIGYFIDRGIEIDETYNDGSFYDLKFSYSIARPDISNEIAIESYKKAKLLSNGSRASLYISYAELVSQKNQNREEFLSLIDKVLEFEINKYPNQRLSNILAKRRADWLKNRLDFLFF